MKLNRYFKILPVALLATGLFSMTTAAQQIKKCQDAEGNWHYGSFAAAACGDAVVEKFNSTGTKVGEDRPPPSEAEIKKQEDLAKAAEIAEEQKQILRKKDIEIVRIYGSEETIISTRDRKLASIDNNIEVTRQIKEGTIKDINKLKEMKKTKKVARQLEERENAVKSYNRVIRHNLTEREKLSENYITILAEFREAHTRIYGD